MEIGSSFFFSFFLSARIKSWESFQQAKRYLECDSLFWHAFCFSVFAAFVVIAQGWRPGNEVMALFQGWRPGNEVMALFQGWRPKVIASSRGGGLGMRLWPCSRGGGLGMRLWPCSRGGGLGMRL